MFADWTWHTSSPDAITHLFYGPRRLGVGMGVEQDTPVLTAPLADTGSLQIQMLDDEYLVNGYHATRHGFLQGALRTDLALFWQSGVVAAGLYCLASQSDLSAGGGTVYGVVADTYLLQYCVRLFSSTVGAQWAGMTWLASSATNVWASGVPFTLELRWRATASSIQLGCWVNAALLLTQTLPGALAFAPVAEGLWMNSASGPGNSYWDTTWLYAGTT